MFSVEVGGYTARFREPLPEGLSREDLTEAVLRTHQPLTDNPEDEPGYYLEERLPLALRHVTGSDFRVVYHHETIEAEPTRRILAAQFTVEPTGA